MCDTNLDTTENCEKALRLINEQRKIKIFDLSVNLSFAVLLSVILIRVLTRPCHKATRFSNSFKVVAAYIALILIAIIYTAVAGFETIFNH